MIFIRIIAFLALSGSSQQGGNKMYTISCGGKNLIDRPPVADNMEHNLSLKIWIFNECFCESNYVIQILPIFTILNIHASLHLRTRLAVFFLVEMWDWKWFWEDHLDIYWSLNSPFESISYTGYFILWTLKANLALLKILKVENQ